MQKQKNTKSKTDGHKLKDWVKRSRLKYPFITKVIRSLPEYFESETFRGDKNALFLTEQGLYVLEQIKKLRKKRAFTIPELGKELDKLGVKKSETVDSIPEAETGESRVFDTVIQDQKDLIQSQFGMISFLESKVKQLESPEMIAEREKKFSDLKTKRIELLQKVRRTSPFRKKKYLDLIDQLETVISQIEDLKR